MSLPVIVIGSGGHAKVVIDALLRSGRQVIGRTDRDPRRGDENVSGMPFLGGDEALAAHDPATVELANGIGSTGDPARRVAVFETFRERGFHFVSVVHPHAYVSPEATIGEGTQIMAGAVCQPGTTIGRNGIVNTGATVDHDCRIGDHVHIAPGATLLGGVTVGDASHVGAGATVIQGVRIGAGCLIRGGAVVIGDVTDRLTVGGVPARVA
jgi:UDP-perosamine 4-acetyltransferase